MSWPNPIETVAVLFGIVSVYLNARQNVWGWATGLINVGLYAWIFFRGHLYALMALQVFFAVISVYGWYQWLRGGERQTGLAVTRISNALGLGLIVLVAAGTGALGWLLGRYTDGQQPYVDAGISVISMAGQWMMACKYLEAWVVWVVVNVIAVPFFLFRGEYPTAVQYSVFLGLAFSGLLQWRRSLAASS